ncbi:MAG: L-serine ammonia-lyase [Proteobacteria bacterium]|nr:L-serine ammonia-lyase [Pseudomonadota bacterium]MBU4132486.1 L-serine ammonia-lyase [Pseudomonadota bacterium]
MDTCITTSIFDIFKTGPGPSSSHTIGPMRAALLFRDAMVRLSPDRQDPLELNVHLFGSLSHTGKGHGTHKAILGGLLGWEPETCDCDLLCQLLEDPEQLYDIPFNHGQIPFSARHIHFEGNSAQDLPFSNTLRFKLSTRNKLLLEKEYYSIGGGFILCKGEIEKERNTPPHAYRNMNQLRKIIRKTGLPLSQIILQNEQAITGAAQDQIHEGLDRIIGAMCACVEKGLLADGLLPGPIGLLRKAKVLMTNSHKMKQETGRFLAMLNAYAMAASEENAAGQRVVTAPTSGSAGVMPGVIYLLKHQYHLSPEQLRQGMLAAAAIAFIAKRNASISGAEVGCQGEVGVASSMAAAFMTYALEGPMKKVENAAEIALEHQLGMTCDPVGGYVQIPCIERNAVGAVTAVNAYILAEAGDPARQKVSFDEVVETMMETGQDMCSRYKETARGGLAVCCVSC